MHDDKSWFFTASFNTSHKKKKIIINKDLLAPEPELLATFMPSTRLIGFNSPCKTRLKKKKVCFVD